MLGRVGGLVLGAGVDLTLTERVAAVFVAGEGFAGGGLWGRRRSVEVITVLKMSPVVGRVLGDDGKVAAGHGDLVVLGCLGAVAGVFVEDLQERLIGVVVEVVDSVSACQQVGNGRWGRLVHDGGGNDVDNVAVVFFQRNVELGFE